MTRDCGCDAVGVVCGRALRYPSLLGLAVLLGLLCVTPGAPAAGPQPWGVNPERARDAGLAGAARVRAVDSNTLAVGLVRLDRRARTLTLPARLNLNRHAIEYALVTRGGKAHESLLTTEAQPRDLHVAALLLGVKPANNLLAQGLPGGIAAQGRVAGPPLPTDLARSERALAQGHSHDGEEGGRGSREKAAASTRHGTGTPGAARGAAAGPFGVPASAAVELEVAWTGQDGERRLPLHQLIAVVSNAPASTIATLAAGPWLYNGSFISEGRFLAQAEGSFVSLIRDPVALINNPQPTRDNDEVHFPNQRLLPSVGTAVSVVFRFPLTDTAPAR